MLLTVPIKLVLTSEQKASLLKTMAIFNAACDFISQYAFEHRILRQFDLHRKLYREVRERFNLPSNFAIRAFAKVAYSYKIDKATEHHFKKRSAIECSRDLLNWKDLITISIASVDSRITKVPIVIPPYVNLTRETLRNTADLIYRSGEFYLNAIVEVPEASHYTPTSFIGVDLGITNIATTSNGTIYSGESCDTTRIRYTKLKGNLQSAGTKSAKRHLKRISSKERNFKRNINHVISKNIVEEARKHNAAISLEDLNESVQCRR